MRVRTELAWWRSTEAKIELDGWGGFTMTVKPRERGARYVVVPIGTVQHDELLDRDKVLDAMRKLMAWEECGGVPDEDENEDE